MHEWQRYGDGACFLGLIDTNKQGLAKVVLAGGGGGGGLFVELMANRLKMTI